MIYYTIPKDSHNSIPFTPSVWNKKISGYFAFLESSKYNLGNSDQYDWNKLCGISWNPLNPNQNATMVAWRYIPWLKKFQVCPYINKSGTIIAYEDNIVEFDTEEVGKFVIDKWGINVVNASSTKQNWVRIPIPSGVVGSWLTAFRIQPWFGGNQVSPNEIKLILSFS